MNTISRLPRKIPNLELTHDPNDSTYYYVTHIVLEGAYYLNLNEILELSSIEPFDVHSFSKISIGYEYKAHNTCIGKSGVIKIVFQDVSNQSNKFGFLKNKENITGYNVVFTVDDHTIKQNDVSLPELLKVLKTVQAVTEDFIAKEDPEFLSIVSFLPPASSPEEDAKHKKEADKKMSVYLGVLRKLAEDLKSFGYTYTTTGYGVDNKASVLIYKFIGRK